MFATANVEISSAIKSFGVSNSIPFFVSRDLDFEFERSSYTSMNCLFVAKFSAPSKSD